MTTLLKLKEKTLSLRKEKSSIASVMQFHVSEVSSIGKNNGNRETSEDEVIQYLKKTVQKLKENKFSSKEELTLLEMFLPQMVSEDEIRSKLVFAFGGKQVHNKGEIMKWAKSHWGNLVDMKQVGLISSELFGV